MSALKNILFIAVFTALNPLLSGGELPFELKIFKDPSIEKVAHALEAVFPSDVDPEAHLRSELSRLLVFEVYAHGEDEKTGFIRSLLDGITRGEIKGCLNVTTVNNSELIDYAGRKKLPVGEKVISASSQVAFLLLTFSKEMKSPKEEQVVIYLQIK